MEISTKEFYEKLSGESLSDQEVFDVKSNFVGFFDLLYRIDKRKEEESIKISKDKSGYPRQRRWLDEWDRLKGDISQSLVLLN